jgi:AcrR family transcriptional regulator
MRNFSISVSHAPQEEATRVPRRVPLRKRPRGTPIPVEPTRERILSAAARLFAEHGFAGASMPAIADLSGITAGAIYRHFTSKAELLLEVVKRALEALPLSFERSGSEDDVALLPDVALNPSTP